MNTNKLSISPPYKNKGLAVCLLATVSLLSVMDSAKGATFRFSFTNNPINGDVDGTVVGRIVLPDGDGIFSATSVVIDSAPSQVFPGNGVNFFNGNVEFNSFEVSNGQINPLTVNFLATSTNNFFLDLFFNNNKDPYGEIINKDTNAILSGQDANNLTFTPIPELSLLFGLIGVSALGFLTKSKKNR